MAKRSVTVFEVKDVSVNVCENEPQDIRCGGPRFVGYDFAVCAGVPDEEIEEFIRASLKKHGRPCTSIHISSTRRAARRRDVWTRRRIEDEIRAEDVTIGTPYERRAKRLQGWKDELPSGMYRWNGHSYERVEE
jgi:hypothetical protein